MKIKPRLPSIGMLNNSLPTVSPKASSKRPMIQNGMSFPAMNWIFFIGVTLICSMVPISFSRTMFIPERSSPMMVMSKTRMPGTMYVL